MGAVHGDEPMGVKVIQKLKSLKLKKGIIHFIIANPAALKRRKRFLVQDLNRSFPGKKNGRGEEKLAYSLFKHLKGFDVVLDIHATNSSIKELAVVSKLTPKIKRFLKLVPVKKVAFVKRSVFGGRESISRLPFGVALEYGPNKSSRNYPKVVGHLKTILINLGFLEGEKRIFSRKEVYVVSGQYHTPDKFRQNPGLREFKFIKKGNVVGRIKEKLVRSKISFYPLFLGKGRYEGVLALIAKRRKLKL